MAARLAWVLAGLTAVAVVRHGRDRDLPAFFLRGDRRGTRLPVRLRRRARLSRDGRTRRLSLPPSSIGWLLSFIGVAKAVAMLAEGVSLWIVNGPGPRGLGGLAGGLSMRLGGPPRWPGSPCWSWSRQWAHYPARGPVDQRWPPDLGFRPIPLRLVLLPTDPVRGGCVPLPALRHRGDHQSDAGARVRHRLRGSGLHRR